MLTKSEIRTFDPPLLRLPELPVIYSIGGDTRWRRTLPVQSVIGKLHS